MTNDDFTLAPGLEAFLNSKIEKAVLAEREACAKIAETHMIERWGHDGSNGAAVGIEIAKVIRARSALKGSEG
jgi:hypothetical protein